MNTAPASESGPYPTNNTRPFFYAQPTTQQPFPNPWYLSHVYNPYCVPAPGFRGGNPYLPFYSVALHEYPGYFVPQHPMHTRVNRRPYFNVPPTSPMFYHATRFRHYSSPGKRTETKETQTDPRQPENKPKKHQDLRTETKGCDAGNMASVSSGIGTETESTSVKQDLAGSSLVPERDFHNKASSSTAQYRNIPSGSYAFEKEEVRIEYGNGSPAIQLWKSFKETIPLYDVASGKPVPENIMQRDLFSVSSCEGVIYSPHEREELVSCASYSDERKTALPLKQSGEERQEKEVHNNEVKLDEEKQGNASQRAQSPLDETKAIQIAELARTVSDDKLVARQNVLSKKSSLTRSSASKASEEESNLVQQAGLFSSSMEITNDSNLQQKKLNQSHSTTTESQITLDKSLWCDESVEKYVPSDSWLARVDDMDANYNYDMCLPQRKRQSVLDQSSDELSSKDEGSSIDNVPVSYFFPDCVLQKSMYTFQKRTEGSERERIKSGGSLNEDEVVGRVQTNVVNRQNFKSCSKVKIKDMASRGRKIGVLPRSSSQKKIYSLKKKAAKSVSLSGAEDSEEYSVTEEESEDDDDDLDEVEYFFQETTPYGTLTPGKGSFYRQIGKRVLWKPPKKVIPAQLISWPPQEKIKTQNGFCETTDLAYKSREKEQDKVVHSDYGYYGKKRLAAKQEVSDHKRTSQKSSRGNLPLDEPKRKRIGKPPYKRRDTRCEAEDTDVWEMTKCSAHKGCGAKRSLYKRR
ncbi:bucky ball-like isoform X2 [Emydura macquarii macquarii]|uniref:bucky ball-like isoform X2 n=1 Tax=Emydura macquarii macquarii TaxID=1129001 RepID=UPI00352ACD20